MSVEPRSTLVLLIPEAEAVVSPWRIEHDPVAGKGVPAHVTLIFPFMPAARVDAAVLAELSRQFSSARGVCGPLTLRFDRLGRFADVAYLALAEPEEVSAKVRALSAAWPEYPPYEGRFKDIVPHLTVAHGDEKVLSTVEAAIRPALPITATVTHATLMVEDRAGQWRPHARFSLDRA